MGISKSPGVKFANVANLGAMIDEGSEIQVSCTLHCKPGHNFTTAELVALAAKVGRDYELYNRRCPCRFTPGCRGWNQFFYKRGVYRPLRDVATSERWFLGPKYSRD
jgi:hypothetical protein